MAQLPKLALYLCLFLLVFAAAAMAEQSKSIEQKYASDPYFKACKAAGGTAKEMIECNGSVNLWCRISEREQCYAEQVQNGKCTVGQYSEEAKGIVGITPKVLCDGRDVQ